MRTSVVLLTVALAACSRQPTDRPADTGAPAEAPEVAIDPEDDLSGLADLPCGRGHQCATGGDWLGDTCCQFGDAIEHHRAWFLLEGVDLEVRDDDLVVCSGFGSAIGRIPDDPMDMRALKNGGADRCQRAALGPLTGDGSRIVYLAHHGDTWVLSPHLWTWLWKEGEGWSMVEDKVEDDVLYEGLALTDAHLFVAAHGGGLRVYEVGADHAPDHLATLDGFDNAVKVAVDPPLAWVIDEADIKVVDVSEPSDPRHVRTVPVDGKPRDIEVEGDRVYVALGADGLQVFERDDDDLLAVTTVELDGSAQAVAADEDLVTVAAWSHTVALDRDTLQVLGTERVEAHFEQTLGVAQTGHRIYTSEWFGVHAMDFHPGIVAPDVWVTEEFLAFDADQADTRKLRVSNRGPLNLLVGGVKSTDEAWTVSAPTGRLLPGEDMILDVDFAPPSDKASPKIKIPSNDPDALDNPLKIPLTARDDSELLDVGDTLTDDFAWLDPTGQGQLSNLEGQVTVLAYFALF